MKQFWRRFLDIVERHPDAIAVQDDRTTLSYAGLAALAAGIGEDLKNKGAAAETPVALELEKSVEYIAAMLGCWYAGAAFVPLPPSLPQQRRDYIVREAEIRHAVSAYDIAAPFQGVPDPARVNEDTLAYIVYTSGSTGSPKGVMVEHRGIVNFIDAQIAAFGTTKDSRYLFYLSILFDAAISDIGVCLLSGARIVIEPPETLKDGARLVKRMQALAITHTDIPPALLKTLPLEDMPASLETIVIGGEACPPETVRRWAKKHRIINAYGPTEATVCTSLCRCDPRRWEKPLIGDPLPGIQYLILDEDMRAAEEGELYIGGNALARGYLKQPELTARKFVMREGKRLYKTGDKVRRQEDGTIEFLCRIDRQFKLRGQLIEPDEIEARLSAHAAVRRAAVLKRGEQLVAFVSAQDGVSAAALAAWLKKSLPEWMLPGHFEFLNDFPLTATGKADLTALSAMPLTQKQALSRKSPSNEVEKKLWAVWQSILKHEDFGVTDDFFAVGGDSLGIIRMTLEAERQGLPFSASSLASLRTVEKMAQAILSAPVFLGCDWLRQDVAFDDAWRVLFLSAGQRPQTSLPAPKNIFLTGAAGCLGSRLLVELLGRTDADIYCLVRAKTPAKALERIRGAVKELSPDDLSRIKPVCGDLSQPFFGLEEEEWGRLIHKMDAVYHCAAQVNMVLSYQDLRPANVAATQEILRFCCTGNRKSLHYASTLSVFVATDQNEGSLLETDRLENTTRVYGGYAQTKWAAEWMLLQVPAEACSITHYRLGLITGDTGTGRMSDTDFLKMFAKGMSALRAAPEGFDDKLHVDVTPIDYAAAAMACLSLQGKDDIYHIANRESLSLGRLLSSIERITGPIARMPVDRWKEVVENKAVTHDETAVILALCRCMPEEFEKRRAMDLFQATDVVFSMARAEADLAGSGIACGAPSDGLLDIYMQSIFRDRKKPVNICVFGPESTGKSTLAEKLAGHYKTSFAPEFAKELIFAGNGDIAFEDIDRIARGQIKSEREAQARADSALFCDTDLITTTIWSDWLFKKCPQWIRDAADLQDFDLYLLMDVDTPWVADVHRFLPDERRSFFDKCREELEKRGLNYVVLSGAWENKFEKSCREINEILRKRLYNQSNKRTG